ncbi:MAG: glycosyltransferase, partial [Candidatus Puniceispirillum sp.]
IATRHAGIPEIITHEVSGLLAPENDADALAALLRQAIDNAAHLPSFVSAAQRRLTTDFDAQTQSRRLQQILLGHS